MKANWNCQVCKGFGVVGDGSRDEQRRCPVCFPNSTDPEPAAIAEGPFSVWHVHGPADEEPAMSLSRGNFEIYADAYDAVLEEANDFANGRMILNDCRGKTWLNVPCPLSRQRVVISDEPHLRYAA